jgi:hypothetical protein
MFREEERESSSSRGRDERGEARSCSHVEWRAITPKCRGDKASVATKGRVLTPSILVVSLLHIYIVCFVTLENIQRLACLLTGTAAMEPAPLLSIPQALIEAHIILDYPSLAPYHRGIPIPIPPGVQITCHHIKAAVLGGNYPPHIQEAAIDLCAKVDAAQRELVFCDFVTRLDRMNVYTRKDPTVPTAALVAALEPILKPIRDSVDALSKKIDGLSTKVDGVATRVDGLESSAAHSKAVVRTPDVPPTLTDFCRMSTAPVRMPVCLSSPFLRRGPGSTMPGSLYSGQTACLG